MQKMNDNLEHNFLTKCRFHINVIKKVETLKIK